jgi:dihydrofolate reductase
MSQERIAVRKTVFAINITADGYCDHMDGIADDELHEYFTGVLRNADTGVFGRKTYELMVPFWPDVAGDQSMSPASNEFARVFNSLDWIVFSKTLNRVEDGNTRLSRVSPEEEVRTLRQRPGKDILIGGLSIASQLSRSGLIDEYHFVVQPFVAGKGPRLFESTGLNDKISLQLAGSTTLHSGVIALHYKRLV